MSDTIASAAGQLGQSTGLTNLGQGVVDLFSGGSGAVTPDQAAGATMPPDTLFGQPMPPTAAVAPTASPNFLQGFAQGFMGMQPGQGASTPMGAGGQIGGGIGQLAHFLSQLQNPGGMVKQQIVNLAGLPKVPSVDVAQNPYVQTQSKPGVIDGIIKGATYGLISSGGGNG